MIGGLRCEAKTYVHRTVRILDAGEKDKNKGGRRSDKKIAIDNDYQPYRLQYIKLYIYKRTLGKRTHTLQHTHIELIGGFSARSQT